MNVIFEPAGAQTTFRSFSKVRKKSYKMAVAAPKSKHFCVKLHMAWEVRFVLARSWFGDRVMTDRRRPDRGTTASSSRGDVVIRGGGDGFSFES